MPFSNSRRQVQRFSATSQTSTSSNILTISGVPDKGFIVRLHVVNSSGTVTPILSEDSAVSSAIKKILVLGSARQQPSIVPIEPIYYEAHDDNGTFKIYLKPVSSTTTTCDYAIDIWAAG